MRAASLLLLLTATYGQQQRIAIYVLSTGKSKRLNGTHTEPLHWLTQRALPALDTWAKGFDRVVFVVEKGFEGSAAGRGCRPARDGTLVCPRLADAHLLAADCTDEYRGAGPCCKCDAAFAHAAGAARPWDWVGFADDDVFFDPVGTCVEINQCVGCTVRNRHRHAIEQASPPWRGGRRTLRKILISTQVGTRHALYSAGDVDAPVAVVPQGSRRRPPFHAPARCRTAMRASYWAQPALLSRGALARAAAAFRAGGTQSECRLFDVSHEGGLGVLLWSLGVESLGLPEPDAYLRDSRRPVWKSTRESTSAGCLKFDFHTGGTCGASRARGSSGACACSGRSTNRSPSTASPAATTTRPRTPSAPRWRRRSTRASPRPPRCYGARSRRGTCPRARPSRRSGPRTAPRRRRYREEVVSVSSGPYPPRGARTS